MSKKIAISILLLALLIGIIYYFTNKNTNKGTTPSITTIPPQPETFSVYGCTINNTSTPTTTNCSYQIKKEDASKICELYGAKLATRQQMNNDQKSGSQWCASGWGLNENNPYSKNYAIYPTQNKSDDGCRGTATSGTYLNICGPGRTSCSSDVNKCEDHTNWCGATIGLQEWNTPDTFTSADVNCYGIKPFKSEEESKKTVPSGLASNISYVKIRPFYNRINNLMKPDTGVEKWSKYS